MRAAIVRIALLQMVTVFIVIVFAGLFLRMRFGSGSHFPCLATHVRDRGFLLLFIPFVWVVWGVWENNSPKVGLGNTGKVMLTGILVWVGLLVFGFVAVGTIPTFPILVVSEKKEIPPQAAVRAPSPPATDAGR